MKLTITDADCGATDRHDHFDGWKIQLEMDGTWRFSYDREGASSVTGYREMGTYELRGGELKLLAQRGRAFCDRGDPGDDTGEGFEWEPVEPGGRSARGLGNAAVTIEDEVHTIRWELSEDCEDLEQEKARREALREEMRVFGQNVSKLSQKFRNLCRPVIGKALRDANGDPDQAGALLHAKDQVAAGDRDDSLDGVYKIFCDWDADGDGVIDRAELEKVLLQVGVPRVDEILAAVDTNGDGRIDFEEFCAWLTGDRDVARNLIAATSVTLRVEEHFKIRGVGDLITGCVEEGILVPGKVVVFEPSHSEKKSPCAGTVKGIQKDHMKQDRADVGDKVGVTIKFRERSRRPKAGDTMVYVFGVCVCDCL